MSGIFISYRREDSAGWTGRLAERLKQKFGPASIFMDIDTIQPGTDFTEALRSAVSSCNVLLAMIGPNWGIARNPEGKLRLDDPDDWVRTELTAALSRNIPVIPILVGGAGLPKADTLPSDLKKLFLYQTHELTDKRWEYDSNQLELVLEKVLGGGKPKRSIPQTLQTYRRALLAVGIVGIALMFALGSPVARRNDHGTGNPQKNGGDLITERSVASLPSPQPVAQPSPMELTSQVPAAATGESGAAEPVPTGDKSKPERIVDSARTESQKGRSLPAGIEVKFNAGDLAYRLVSLRLEENSTDSWNLVTSFAIRNTGAAGAYVHYFEDFRLLIDGGRRSPTKSSGLTTVESDSENTGETTFLVPKSARTIGLQITRKEMKTIVPINFTSGVSRLVVQPADIPKVLSRLSPIHVNGGGTYDFHKLMLEPYNAESLLLRVQIRITAINEGFYFDGNHFRIVVEGLSYEPIRGNLKLLAPHTHADEEVLFLVPKSAIRALLRYPNMKWESPIDLKAGKS